MPTFLMFLSLVFWCELALTFHNYLNRLGHLFAEMIHHVSGSVSLYCCKIVLVSIVTRYYQQRYCACFRWLTGVMSVSSSSFFRLLFHACGFDVNLKCNFSRSHDPVHLRSGVRLFSHP